MMRLRYGSVCSGIEAASVAFEPLGWEPAWFSQYDPKHDYSRGHDFPSSVLAHHWPDVTNLGDMTGIAGLIRFGEVEAPDVLIGGTPCQSFSIAGLRKGISDERGNLTLKYVELVNEIDRVRNQNGKHGAIAIWENVPGVLSSKDNAFGCFLAALAGDVKPYEHPRHRNGKFKSWGNAGVVFGPERAIAWRVVDAQFFGLAQRRRRVLLVASSREDFHPAQILFEFDGVRRDSAPSRTTQTEDTRNIETKPSEDNPWVMAHGQGGAEINNGLSPTLTCNHEVPIVCVTGERTHTLTAEGFDASEDGTGRGTPIVAFNARQDPDFWIERTGLLDTDGATNGINTADGVRRLTPVECERLQGFPDEHTNVPHRMKPAADGPRYKCIGNSMAVPCIRWLGYRIEYGLRRPWR